MSSSGSRAPLRLFGLWLAIGWGLVVLVVWLSLGKVPPLVPVAGGDKIGHFLAYGSLMLWFGQLYRSRARVVACVLLICLGISLEYLQQFTGRLFETADMLANSIGVGIGLLVLCTPLDGLLGRLESVLPNAAAKR